MNLWECDFESCNVTADGIGPAAGLRSIGWYVREGAGPDGGCLTVCPWCAHNAVLMQLRKEVEERRARAVSDQ